MRKLHLQLCLILIVFASQTSLLMANVNLSLLSKNKCTIVVPPCDINIPNIDCDGDGLTNSQEALLGTNPNMIDTDGDGVIDGTESNDLTNPVDGCSYLAASITEFHSPAWNLLDCDGDGVINGTEMIPDGTNPKDYCSYFTIHITLTQAGGWLTADCDNDGLINNLENQLGTDPLKSDSDGDGVVDGQERTDNTIPTDGCSYINTSITLFHSADWDQLDCDGDGVLNGVEMIPDGTNPKDPCQYSVYHVILNKTGIWLTSDCDNDSLPNGKEVELGTNPDIQDSDGDGVMDGIEVKDATNPLLICEYVTANITLPVNHLLLDTLDCDNDGVINITEASDATNPQDPCSLIKEHITLTRTKYCGPEIPEGFSPNNDGINDFYVIRGLSDYPNNSLSVYNRWGNIVYKANPYNSDWGGEASSNIKLGNEALPVGVYFYILDLGDGSKPYKGNLFINR